MKTLVIGAGVIGATYAWQLSEAGYPVTVMVREGKKDSYEREGIMIRCTDQRGKHNQPSETIFRPTFVEAFTPKDNYDLIIVAVKSNQLDALLPTLYENAGKSHILFFQNNWWGDAHIKEFLFASQYLFGFPRLVGGWRTGSTVECMISSSPGMSTVIGEVNGTETTRLKQITEMFTRARLKPKVSHDILGWLATHYVEYLGAVGGILQAGSASAFSGNGTLVREAILATREGLDVCGARGIDIGKAAPLNLRMYALPLTVIVPLGQKQYQSADIQRFFDENIAHDMDEIALQYYDVLNTGERLGVPMPHLKGFEKYYAERRAEQGPARYEHSATGIDPGPDSNKEASND